MKSTRLIFGATMLAIAHGAFAAELSADAVKRCAAMTDSLARLVCYDQLASGTPSPAAPAAAAVPAPVAPAPAPAPAVAPAVVAPAVAVSKTPQIGDESMKGATEPKEMPTSLTATVASLQTIRAYNYFITLDNGQQWQQEEMQSGFFLEVGDTVQIERGKMGGYKLATVKDGKPRGMWVRVTRKK